MTKLVLSDGSVRWVPKEYMERLPIFEKCHELLVQGEYRVKSEVSEKVVDVFLARLFAWGFPEKSGAPRRRRFCHILSAFVIE